VRAKVASLSSIMPSGYAVAYPVDNSSFVRTSIKEVIETLVIAIILVVIVMYLFLQSWRATLVPAIAVPVVLLGTFGILSLFGYSINTLTLFGMVLAIGLLVDDAIVVVENVERLMTDNGMNPREATIASMDEIGSALVGIAMVLSAVLLPMAFFGGSTGVIYRQFSVTIVAAMALSVLVALVLSPALCATMLKPGNHDPLKREGFFGKFNRWLDRQTTLSGRRGKRDRAPRAASGRVCGHCGGDGAALRAPAHRLPAGRGSGHGDGHVPVARRCHGGARQSGRRQIQKHYMEDEKNDVAQAMVVNGFSFNGQGQNAGMGFIALAPFDDRKAAKDSVKAMNARAFAAFSKIRDAVVFPLVPPPFAAWANRAASPSNCSTPPTRPRHLRGAARQADRGGQCRSQAGAGARGHAGRCAPAARGHRRGQAGRAGPDRVRCDRHAQHRLGQHLCQRLRRPRPRQARLCAGLDSSRMLPGDIEQWYVRSSTNGNMVPFSAFAPRAGKRAPTSSRASTAVVL
jgi:multidrug efflux pump